MAEALRVYITPAEKFDKEHNHLQPICDKEVPVEITPLIAELNSLFSRLRENYERESRFAADAAHELKTPLAALKTHAQVAEKHNDITDIKNELRKVDNAISRAVYTVEQLLTLSRTMPEAYTKNHYPVKLPELIRSTTAELIPKALKKNITIAFEEHQDNKQAQVLAHKTTLAILLSNLIDNAIRYSLEHTTITLSLYGHNQYYQVHIKDQGPGIPKELEQRVFERFFRVTGTKTRGSGLGLSIVRQIAKAHQAEVTSNSPKMV